MPSAAKLWSSSVWQLEGSNSIIKECILYAFEEEWHIRAEKSIPYGHVRCSVGVFDGSWARVGRSTCESKDARWLRIINRETKDLLEMSLETLKNFFGFDVVVDQPVVINVTVATLPEYINCHETPTGRTQQLKVRILNNLTTQEALLFENFFELFQDSLREKVNGAILREGDLLCIEVKATTENRNSLLIPVVIEEMPDELLVTFPHCNIEISSPPRFMKLFRQVAMPYSSIPWSLEHCNDNHPYLFSLYGPIFASRELVVAYCGQNGIPVMNMKIENWTEICEPPCKVGWILCISKSSSHLFNFLKTVCAKECNAPCLLFLLHEDILIEPLSRLVVKKLDADNNNNKTKGNCTIPKASNKAEVKLEAVAAAGERDAFLEAVECLCHVDQISLPDAMKVMQKDASGKSNSEVSKVYWSDVAGLEDAKKLLVETLRTPLVESQLVPKQLGRRCGVLLYGPPGTGKTLVAKAIATEFELNFLSIKGPELLDIYIGESEEHLRQVFSQARSSRPCVLFFDELDSLAIARGSDGDAGKVTDRLVAQLITELDSLSWDAEGEGVFIIGATNRPDLLDPALCRPGRFDKLVYLGIPTTSEEQVKILRTASRNYLVGLDVDFERIAENIPKDFSPADLASVCHTAMKLAISKIVKRSFISGTTPLADHAVSIGSDDMMEALSLIRPISRGPSTLSN